MTPDELRVRLIAIVADPTVTQTVHGDDAQATFQPEFGTFQPGHVQPGHVQPGHAEPVPAAVLVPVVLGARPGILLTKRNAHLARHAGQISFPGGRIDPEDAGPEAAALRETQEEIGLDPQSVQVLGRMADHITGTGYRITPVLGLVTPGALYKPSPHEVEAVFELPMDVVLDPNAPTRQRQHVGGRWREYWVWPHPEHYIWGATAAILVHLAERLRKGNV